MEIISKSYLSLYVSHYTITIGSDGKVENKLARGSLKIKKVDTFDKDNVMSGITFKLSAKEDMSEIITTAMTGDDSIAYFNDLELGTYFVQESQQVDGYTLNDYIYKVEVTIDGDILLIECENKPTEMIFSKVDATNNKELAGATITVTEKETGDIVDKWVSTEEIHTIRYLVEGKEYIMTEVIAPDGFEIAESITFTAKDGIKVTMKDKRKPENVNTGDSTDTMKLILLLGVSLSVIGSILYLKNKKREDHNE